MNTRLSLEITDDSGFLALVDPDAYTGFVDAEWAYSQLIEHFKTKMRVHQLLIWRTGRENTWRIEITTVPTDVKGFRQVTGSMFVSHDRLLVTNYESLTMAAQFKDLTLPEPHQRGLVFSVPSGAYRCRIIQVYDPETPDKQRQANQPDFIIELVPSKNVSEAWTELPYTPDKHGAAPDRELAVIENLCTRLTTLRSTGEIGTFSTIW